MSTKAHLLLAVALTAAAISAALNYGLPDDISGSTESSAPTPAVRSAPTLPTESTEQPSTAALVEDRRQPGETPAEGQQQSSDVDQQIRSFTIPLERAVAGMEEYNSKGFLPVIAEFKETLEQFAGENEDPTWSLTTETRIFSEISQATGLSAGDIQVDCRATLCRVLLTNPSSAPNPRYSSLNELADSFGLETMWALAVPDENRVPVNFLYLRRPEGAAR